MSSEPGFKSSPSTLTSGPSGLRVDPASSLLVQIAGLLRQAQVYELTNSLFTNALPSVLSALEAINPQGEVTLDLVADSFFINKALIKLNQSSFEASDLLKKIFARFGVQQLRFGPGTTDEQLREFLGQVQRFGKTSSPKDIIREPKLHVCFATVQYALGGTAASIDSRQNVLRLYARLAALLDGVVKDAAAGRPFRSPHLRKTVQALVQASDGHDSLLTGLTRFANFTGSAHYHLSAVAALTLLMGKRLKLSRLALIDVVVAAALHELMRPEGRGEHLLATSTPFQSMMAAVRDSFSVDAMMQGATAFEAHMPAMHTGVWAPGPLGKLIAVPCAFDRLTSGKTERALAPDQALRAIHAEVGKRFDARIVKLFTATVGVFPIGSVVRLSTGDLAVVLEVPREARQFSRPVVKIIRNASGPCDIVVDLSVDQSGGYVVESVDETTEQVNPTSFLLA